MVRRISIHRSLAGPDVSSQLSKHLSPDFNPQVPCGTRPIFSSITGIRFAFQSTGPLRDPTRRRVSHDTLLHISIHRSLAGPDIMSTQRLICCRIFQSTGPLRDPTGTLNQCRKVAKNFNPQVPCGTRPKSSAPPSSTSVFQSTGPLRDPTSYLLFIYSPPRYFNPQVPCGTRLKSCFRSITTAAFQSTGPLRDPTNIMDLTRSNNYISIHRSLAGPDDDLSGSVGAGSHFNPQVPCGTRPHIATSPHSRSHFNPQVPCGTRLFAF